jgi:hypothetical protein
MDLWKQNLLRAMRHAQNYARKLIKLDKPSMLRLLASLKSSSLRRPALGRGLFIAGLAIALSCAGSIKATAKQKPLHVMNIKLYAYNQMSWEQFQCYNYLIHHESRWSYTAKNGSHWGLGQMRSAWYGTLNPYKQIDVHLKYIAHRYDGKPCKALAHWERKGWH